MRTPSCAASAAAGFVTVAMGLLLAAPAQAAPTPGWQVNAFASPTNFVPHAAGTYKITAHNVGAAATDGVSKIKLSDTLPPGITAISIARCAATFGGLLQVKAPSCVIKGGVPTFFWKQEELGPVPSGGSLYMDVSVSVAEPPGPTVTDEAEVSGGGAPAASTSIESPLISADAPFGIDSFAFDATEEAGLPAVQAAAHPYALTVNLNASTYRNHINDGGIEVPQDGIRDILTDLPLGFFGNPQAVPQCPEKDVAAAVNCPASSQIGILTPRTFGRDRFDVAGGATEVPVYNMVPARGYPAELGFTFDAQPVLLFAELRPGDYGLRVIAPGLTHATVFSGAELTIWGTPAETRHDAQRVIPGECVVLICPHGAHAEIEPRPYLTNSSDCADPTAPAALHLDSWHESAPLPFYPAGTPNAGARDFAAANLAEPQWRSRESAQPSLSGCNALSFAPSLALQPDTARADSPAGLNVNLKVPQSEEEPEARATPPLKAAVVTLPKGLAVDPSSADGLAGCGLAQAGLGSVEAATCPPASKIGEVEVITPLLEKPLPGQVYIGTPSCAPCTNQDAEEGKLINLYIQIDDPERGVIVKIPGTVAADPATGQLVATFKQNPQLPFSDLKLNFKTGQRATLTTPSTCGEYTTSSDLTPWSTPETPDAISNSSFQVTEACAPTEAAEPNHPAFSAGTINPSAGAYSPFVLKLTREDGSQPIKAIDTTLPPGLTGKLAGVGECPDAQIEAARQTSGAEQKASPSCPLSSEVGSVNVGAGSGAPFYVQGRAYLAGPYKGAPLSLAIITPATAGPFDLGTVVVRTALHVNPETAQITAKSDPIPTILAGIPLDVRSIALNMDRPNFTLNPTSCDPMSLSGEVFASSSIAAVSSPFQVGGCSALGFAPKLAISLKGPTKRAQLPALKAVVTYPAKGAYSNIAKAQVTLPHSEFLDQGHLNDICTKVVFAEGQKLGEKCPPSSIYGFAKAETPLLEKPLEGPVYLRSPLPGHKLPDLVAALNGQVDVALVGKVDTGKGGGIRNTFEAAPDAPVTRFTLEMKGGSKGLLVNSEDICAKPQKAIAHFVAQSGKVDDYSPLIANSCPKKGHHKHHKKARTHR